MTHIVGNSYLEKNGQMYYLGVFFEIWISINTFLSWDIVKVFFLIGNPSNNIKSVRFFCFFFLISSPRTVAEVQRRMKSWAEAQKPIFHQSIVCFEDWGIDFCFWPQILVESGPQALPSLMILRIMFESMFTLLSSLLFCVWLACLPLDLLGFNS